jgi:hypothetical protein
MVDWTGVIAIVGFFGTLIVAFVSFGPVGRAIGTRILRKAGTPPELGEQVDELADRVEGIQRQVAELAERQDFAERLLAKVREKELPAGGPS